VVAGGETLAEPETALPVEKLLPVHEVVFVEVQVRREEEPFGMVVGLAEREAVEDDEVAVMVTALPAGLFEVEASVAKMQPA
jgi:hypothetical protein